MYLCLELHSLQTIYINFQTTTGAISVIRQDSVSHGVVNVTAETTTDSFAAAVPFSLRRR